MYEALHGDGTTSPTPVFQLTADLIQNKVRNFLLYTINCI